jgi:hypothetical protein
MKVFFFFFHGACLGCLTYFQSELIAKLLILQTEGWTPWTGDQTVASSLPT